MPLQMSPLDFSLPSRDPNLLGAFHVGNYFLWHPKAFDPIVDLLVHLNGHHLVIFLLLLQVWCGGLEVSIPTTLNSIVSTAVKPKVQIEPTGSKTTCS